MKKRNKKIIGIFLFINLILLGLIFAQDWPAFNVCCEKTLSGAWCQNALEERCDASIDPVTKSPYRKTPTSCDGTSFCKLGCCVDSDEGLCMENTPQKVCQISTGTWIDDPQCNVPQCTLGCCLLGDQASFVTLTRCKKLSSFYGLNTNFKKDVTNEAQCILMAYYQDKGACVYYNSDAQKTCKFVTRQECLNSNKKGVNTSAQPDFYKDYLCSADELATDCGPTTNTICIQGKDEVYFKDTCGNPANIYDANRIYSKDAGYWQKIVPKSETCGFGSKKGNINSKTCGNCNYLEGSICGKGTATYGEYICKDLNCYKTENGNNYKNGESWCIYQAETGNGKDPPGSRHFRHVCIHGEETIEPCADFRNEVCIQDKIPTYNGDFIEAACRVNRWKDCIDQYRKRDCENTDKRDCYWVEGYAYDKAGGGGNSTVGSTQNSSVGKGIIKANDNGICLPDVPPGLKFWEGSEASAICSLGNSYQVVDYETDLFKKKKCVNNCEVLTIAWVDKMNSFCTSLGDCGAKANVFGKYTDDGVLWKENGKRKVTEGMLSDIKNSAI